MSPNPAIPRLWHTPKVALSIGDVIPPGRFGRGVIASGGTPNGLPLPPLLLFFFRECMIEHVRATRNTSAPVSRLKCAFAFESREIATILAAVSEQPCYEVAPVDPGAPTSRHDMAWIEWMGRPDTTPSDVVDAIERYWDETPIQTGTTSQWEWLSSSGLRVIGDA